jgi:anti-sigma factor RsiW
MGSLLKKDSGECSRFLESLEDVASEAALSPALRAHAAGCKECAAAVDEWLASRKLLKAMPRPAEVAKPWFAPKVMAAIAARESELRRSLDAWTVVPKLASKLAWVSALALVLTGTWLMERPMSAPQQPVVTDLAGEPVSESVPLPATNDDMLVSLTEKAQ